VLGSDAPTDIAVLEGRRHGPAGGRAGQATATSGRDQVLAIGSPFGFEQTATQGIVSAKAARCPATRRAVHPDRRGGEPRPTRAARLFDAGGRVIWHQNAQSTRQSGGLPGAGVRPSRSGVALHVKDQIVITARVEHARLGVMLQNLNQSLAPSRSA